MRIVVNPVILLLLSAVFISCTAPAEEAVPELSTESTTSQALDSTQTPLTPTVTQTVFALPSPSGEPVAEWEGIPVMPGAAAGDGNSQGYAFVIAASIDEVQAFYENELAEMEWNLFAVGQGGSDTVMLIFMKGNDRVSVSILPESDGMVYVLLVK